MKNIIALFIVLFIITGCAWADYYRAAKFKRLEQTTTYDIYEYETGSSLEYPENTKSGEDARMYWLQRWLKDNNLQNNKYEILKRDPIIRYQGVFGPVHTIYYTIKIYK